MRGWGSLWSPISRAQVADQPAAECLPLVMEPESQYYTSPVVVLDFQSLYPSMIIAYNLCYSTCLGRVPKHGSHVCVARKFGCASLHLPPGELAKACKSELTVTPNGWAQHPYPPSCCTRFESAVAISVSSGGGYAPSPRSRLAHQ